MAYATVAQLRRKVGVDRDKCIDFNNTDSYLTGTYPATFTAANLTEFTIAVRLYPRSNGGGGAGRIISNINQRFVEIFTQSGGYNCQIWHDTTSATASSGSGTIQFNKWQTLFMTFSDEWDYPKVYIDGVEFTSSPTNKSGSRGNVNTETISIGNRSDLIRGFDGLMDDVFVWNSILSQEQMIGYINSDIPSGYLLGYTMDESSGDVIDQGSSGADLTPSQVTQDVDSYNIPSRSTVSNRFVVNDFGNSLLFTSTSGRIDCGNSATLHNSTLTYLAWIKAYSSATNRTIIGWSGNGTPQLRLNTGNALNFLSQNSAQIGTGSVIPLDKWVQVGVTYDSSGNYVFYINGETAGSGTDLKTFTFGTSTMYIGNIVGFGQAFRGSIDNVRMYNSVLTGSQIQSIYYDESQLINSNLKGYWKFNEGSGTSATDSSGNGNTGIITGASYSEDVFMVSRTAV